MSDEKLGWIEEHVLVPTVHAMNRAKRPFRGVLYAGIMMTYQGPKVLEFNCRFGDPECQPLLMRLKTELMELLNAAVDGRLDKQPPLEWDPRPAVCVVMAAKGYPDRYEKGQVIRGLADADEQPDVKVFHAGSALDGQGNVVTAGGRVLGRRPPWAEVDFHCEVECLSRREADPLGRRLVPQGYLRQGVILPVETLSVGAWGMASNT